MTDVRVDVIGKVDRRGTGGQVNDVAARGEDVHAVLKDIGAHGFDELCASFTSVRHSIIERRELMRCS
jgi:hypothetical protein